MRRAVRAMGSVTLYNCGAHPARGFPVPAMGSVTLCAGDGLGHCAPKAAYGAQKLAATQPKPAPTWAHEP